MKSQYSIRFSLSSGNNWIVYAFNSATIDARHMPNSHMDNSRLVRQVNLFRITWKTCPQRLLFLKYRGSPCFCTNNPFVWTVSAQRLSNRRRNAEPSAKIVALYIYRFLHLRANKECKMPFMAGRHLDDNSIGAPPVVYWLCIGHVTIVNQRKHYISIFLTACNLFVYHKPINGRIVIPLWTTCVVYTYIYILYHIILQSNSICTSRAYFLGNFYIFLNVIIKILN